MDIENDGPQWAQDTDVLAQIGRVFYSQRPVVRVRIPRSLAEQAVTSWEKYLSGPGLPSADTSEQRALNQAVATLGLIGRSLQLHGVAESDETVLELHAWHIGNALNAASQAGLLDDLAGPPSGY